MRDVINTHDQLIRWKEAGMHKRPVAIMVYHASFGRSNHRDGWCVYSPWAKTSDTVEPWYHHGDKHFNRFLVKAADLPDALTRRQIGPARDKAALVLAMQWADHKYGPFDWVRNRMGDYVPAELNKAFPLPRK